MLSVISACGTVQEVYDAANRVHDAREPPIIWEMPDEEAREKETGVIGACTTDDPDALVDIAIRHGTVICSMKLQVQEGR
jgi:hypothetical protein